MLIPAWQRVCTSGPIADGRTVVRWSGREAFLRICGDKLGWLWSETNKRLQQYSVISPHPCPANWNIPHSPVSQTTQYTWCCRPRQARPAYANVLLVESKYWCPKLCQAVVRWDESPSTRCGRVNTTFIRSAAHCPQFAWWWQLVTNVISTISLYFGLLIVKLDLAVVNKKLRICLMISLTNLF